MDDNNRMKGDIVELQNNERIQIEFEKLEKLVSGCVLVCTILNTLTVNRKRALEVFVLFATTYLCEASF